MSDHVRRSGNTSIVSSMTMPRFSRSDQVSRISASLKYRDEAEVLAAFGDQEEGYLRHILPDKIVLGKQYVRSSSLALDLVLIGRTILEVIGLHRVRVRR